MSDPYDIDREVDDAMHMFERSRVGNVAALTPLRPARILLVLDGSSQDATSIDAAGVLRARFNVETLVLDASSAKSTDEPEDIAAAAVNQLNGAKSIASPISITEDEEAFDIILAALQEHKVDLVLVPCPFGRSFERVGVDSVGTVIDVLLSRCPVPLLVIRHDDQSFTDCIRRISVLVSSECDVEEQAAAWAFGLASKESEVSLNLIVEKEHFENIRNILETLRPGETLDAESLSDTLVKAHSRLHVAMNKTATEVGCRYYLLPQASEDAPPNSEANPQRQLLVLPLEVDDSFEQGFVHDRIRHSPHPVLVIPGHVPQ